MNAGLIDGGDHILCSTRGGSDDVHVHFESSCHHPQRVVNARLFVEDELLGQQMNDLAICRKWNRARFVHGLSNFFSHDFARARSEADSTMAIDTTDMRASDAHESVLNRNAGSVFSLLYCLLNGRNSLFQIDDHTLPGTSRLRQPMSAVAQPGVRCLCNKHGGSGASYVHHRQKICSLIRHAL